uniref:Protein lin-10 n=1 Tax=Anopheles farauti TaxID=69004 RepID=A0A182QYK7_9DIPT
MSNQSTEPSTKARRDSGDSTDASSPGPIPTPDHHSTELVDIFDPEFFLSDAQIVKLNEFEPQQNPRDPWKRVPAKVPHSQCAGIPPELMWDIDHLATMLGAMQILTQVESPEYKGAFYSVDFLQSKTEDPVDQSSRHGLCRPGYPIRVTQLKLGPSPFAMMRNRKEFEHQTQWLRERLDQFQHWHWIITSRCGTMQISNIHEQSYRRLMEEYDQIDPKRLLEETRIPPTDHFISKCTCPFRHGTFSVGNRAQTPPTVDETGSECSQNTPQDDDDVTFREEVLLQEHATASNPSPTVSSSAPELEEETDTDHETDRLLGHQQQTATDNRGYYQTSTIATLTKTEKPHVNVEELYPKWSHKPGVLPNYAIKGKENKPNEANKAPLPSTNTATAKTQPGLLDPSALIDGAMFRARYLGSTQLVCEGQPTKLTRMMQAEEAVARIKAPAGESQPSTDVDLSISTEKIMVLNTDLKEVMMDHALRTISYIADIGNLVVLMARRRYVGTGDPGDDTKTHRTPTMICHVFETEEAQLIAQSIGQAFQVAYMEFLKANGIEDHSFMKEMDYQEVLNSQEIFGDELEIFAKKELQKEVVVPKAKGEILGVVIVESGWGSMLPTVVIANLASSGAAARCGQLNIGDQIIAINGLSLVGLPLSTCQGYIKNTKNQTVVKFTVVPCAPVVEVKIKRPNTKYQLGFSVQNGVICSLLRGGIAERGGVRVGHRIIEINNQSVVAVPHNRIVNLLSTSVGEIHMKTMPTAMFRLLTGQDNPLYI